MSLVEPAVESVTYGLSGGRDVPELNQTDDLFREKLTNWVLFAEKAHQFGRHGGRGAWSTRGRGGDRR